MTAWFITATGTDIGKTVLTAALCRALRAQGAPVRALKPVISGYAQDEMADSDSGRILASLGVAPTDAAIAAITPWRFKAPLSPDMAAAREGRVIDFDALVDFCTPKNKSNGEDIVLIEGVGGAMVPLTDRETVLDWIVALRAPALVVAGSYLGTISHTLTTVAAMRARGAEVAAVVVSESAESPVPLAETAAVLRRFLGGVPVFTMPRADTPVVSADLLALLTKRTTGG
ncbi:MAG: dethiobiotin synthase [Rhodospirillaceae bacterium]|jgi:dethiobiotin synthetase|nr:dethiobiotin synthase [Rhodospirillaceae bacterium]MBT5811701.1 dethiobiotin synthase [Rhodospirillaceae bacterium]